MGKQKPQRSSYQRQFGGGGKSKLNAGSDDKKTDDLSAILAAKRRARQQKAEQIDEQVFGFETFAFHNTNGAESREARERRGWLFNMLPTTVRESLCFTL